MNVFNFDLKVFRVRACLTSSDLGGYSRFVLHDNKMLLRHVSSDSSWDTQ